ncbi:MAG: IS3 family transposase [Lentisphaeria bacterium]|nr:IS3 family transposase [Lentisphaeria bacterium]
MEGYICYFNYGRASLRLGGMSPVEYRTHLCNKNRLNFWGHITPRHIKTSCVNFKFIFKISQGRSFHRLLIIL